MKILKVLKVDSIIFSRKLPLILLAIIICVAAFLAAIPPKLMQSGDIPKVSIAFAYEGEDDEIIGLAKNFLEDIDMILEFHVVTHAKADEMLKNKEVDTVVSFPDDSMDRFIDGEPFEIGVKANDAFIGSLAYGLVNEAIRTLNRVPQIALKFHRMIKPLFTDKEEYYRVDMAFQFALIQETLMRQQYLKTEPTVPTMQLQAMSLILFLVISVVAVFMTTLTANQLAVGGIRRLKIRGISFIDIWLGKTIIVVGISVVLCMLASVLFVIYDINFSVVRLLLSVILLATVLHMICMVFTLPKYSAKVASTRAMLGCIAMLLMMLFAGGGFYPIHLMDFNIKLFNPAWLSHLLAEWIIAGTQISPLNLLLFIVPAIICGLLSLKTWRDILC